MAYPPYLDAVWGLENIIPWVAAVLVGTGLWRYLPLRTTPLHGVESNPGLGLLRACVLFAGLYFWWVLATGADGNIAGKYTALYALLAFACLLWFAFWKPILSVWHRSDVLERGNLGAALILAGFVLGTAFAFGGALSGSDTSCQGARAGSEACGSIRALSPGETWGIGGWHVVLAFFLLAYVELRANMAIVDRLGGGLSRQARVERDPSAGLLLGAVAAATGLIAGRAAAGDFEGWGPAFADYRHRLWPILIVPFAGALAGFLTTDRARPLLWRGLASVALVAFGASFHFLT